MAAGLSPKLTYHTHPPSTPQANWLRGQGVRKGDVVTLYLPMICELPIAMLACARIGAVHSVVFAGFSADALAQRLQDGK
jgi:acetyl-CoA synthetase